MKVSEMEKPQEVDMDLVRRLEQEAVKFMDAHPEYNPCLFNKQALVDYLKTHDLHWTRENFGKVYQVLWDSWCLVPSQVQVNRMPSKPRDEYRERLERIGIRKTDTFGRVYYEWPAPITQDSGLSDADKNHRIGGHALRPVDYDASRKFEGYRPTKFEFHQKWTGDTIKQWMYANNLTDIPDYLR